MDFKNAVVISAFVHAAIVLPLCNPVLPKQTPKKEMVVDYVILEEPVKIKEAARDIELKIPETPKVELKPRIETAPSPVAPSAKAVINKDAPQELAEKQARIKTTKDYINYYQLIREKIRRNLKAQYRNAYGEGDVGLIFMLRSDGTLVSCEIDRAFSVGDQTLRDIALTSLKDAAPFAPFPKALTIPQMSFTLTVSFKKKQ